MIRNLWFQLHWLLGISAGIVIAVVGFTGGMLSFEDEILRWLNPGILSVAEREGGPLSPPQLYATLQQQNPARTITALAVQADPGRPARVTFAPLPGQATEGGPPVPGRGENRYVDPYTGALLGQPQHQEFFRTTRQVHRWLAVGDVGRQIVGASTIALIIMACTGLYLRWPRRFFHWRSWFRLDFSRRGRNLLWELHSVIGGWVLIPYLVMSLTGLWWSYPWYRDFLYTVTGAERPPQMQRPPAAAPPAQQGQGAPQGGQGRAGGGGQRGGSVVPAEAVALDWPMLWSAFQAATPGYSTVTLRPPARAGQPISFSYQDPNPPHERANNTLTLDSATGAVREHKRYDDQPVGQKIMTGIFPLHSGSFFGKAGLIVFMLASFLMPLFAVTGWMLYLDRRKKKRAISAARPGLPVAGVAPAGDPVLIVFASQSGTAERLAWQSAGVLRAAGLPVHVDSMARIDGARLAAAPRILFIVSTFGDGEAPDSARSFFRRIMSQTAALSSVSYGLMALGDSHYQRFCGFGRDLDTWLRHQGAKQLFDRVEIDNSDEGALRHWQSHLGQIGGIAQVPDWAPPAYGRWRLAERRHLNPGSPGGAAFHLALTPQDAGDLSWVAGDIAEVGPHHGSARVAEFLAAASLDGRAVVQVNGEILLLAEVLARSILPDPASVKGQLPQVLAVALKPLPHREYSIASVPEDGSVQLLVRRMSGSDGRPGLGSGWLTEFAAEGGEIALRIRGNAGFHPPADDRPLLLIGNGTGLAGLRAHLKAAARAGRKGHWLVFGERSAAHDAFHAEEIAVWYASGVLARVDTVFSRDQADKVYVQHRLHAAAADVRAFVERGAAIYVCGSLEGMAPGVEAALVEILGAEALEKLAGEGRYRRDVY